MNAFFTCIAQQTLELIYTMLRHKYDRAKSIRSQLVKFKRKKRGEGGGENGQCTKVAFYGIINNSRN